MTTELLIMKQPERSHQNKIIQNRVISHPKIRQAHKIGIYNSLMTEPYTYSIIDILRNEEKEVYTPSFRKTGDTLFEMVNQYGKIIPPQELDVMVMPGRAFTMNGYRLGRGGGHFDRYLEQVNPECYKIGLCFQNQIQKQIPLDEWDIKMNEIITGNT